MSPERRVVRSTRSQPTLEGAGVHLHRAVGFGDEKLFDPFLLLDDFRGDDPRLYLAGFPWHPHRGIETITYVLEGDVEHGDSLGNGGIIGSGDVQWMTAGSGIIHQEMPKGSPAGRMHGFQLWANLPAADKMMPPRYRGLTADQIPAARLAGGVVAKVICGRVGEVAGPVRDVVIAPEYLDVTVPPGATFSHPTAPDHTVFAYVIGGRGRFGATGEEGGNRDLLLFGPGAKVAATAGEAELRFLLISGRPLREPIAWRGPIVMNTREQLDQAFREYREGTFIK